MTDSLHREPERDHFKTESPIRAFTDWSVQGLYALGKGFRPSLAHLVPYLNAMEEKEGWRLLQILEAGTQTPSFVFRLERVISDDVLIDRLQGPDSFKQQVRDLLQGEPPYPYLCPAHPDKIAIGLRQVAHDMMADTMDALVNCDFADRIRGYALELAPEITDRHCGFEEAGTKIDAAREMSADMDDDPYAMMAEVLKDAPPFEPRIVTMSPALGAPFGHWGDGTTPDHVEYVLPPIRQGVRRTGPMIPIPELVYWSGEDSNFYGQVSRRGQGQAFFDKWYPRRDEFPTTTHDEDRPSIKAEITDINPQHLADAMGLELPDDPINPKHYGGRECADIGERLTANSYQVLKYNWRLGEKDSPCVELGKSIWYLDSEMELYADSTTIFPLLAFDRLPEHPFFDARLKGKDQHVINVARALISWNRYGNPATLKTLRKLLQAKLDAYKGCEDWEYGEGLKP